MNDSSNTIHGVLLLDKPPGKSSFHFVHLTRKKTAVQKIGHAGTLDPFASGLLILLIGKTWTKQQDQFMKGDKEYLATIVLGCATDTYDKEGTITVRSSYIPSLQEVLDVVSEFQGESLQTPPMYSAKRVQGVRLYELARKGIEIERASVPVHMLTKLISYEYPRIELQISCSKGTYIRSIGDSMGKKLGSYAYVESLQRVRSGQYTLQNAISYKLFSEIEGKEIDQYLLHPEIYL